MGFNTTVMFLNDTLHDIKEHPEQFVEELVRAVYALDEVDILGQTMVMRPAHADVFRLYGTHENSIIELSRWSARTRALAEKHPDVVQRFIIHARRSLDDLED